jgi:hypothetical protein
VLISQERKQPFDMCETLLWSLYDTTGLDDVGRGGSHVIDVYIAYTRDCLISLPSRTIPSDSATSMQDSFVPSICRCADGVPASAVTFAYRPSLVWFRMKCFTATSIFLCLCPLGRSSSWQNQTRSNIARMSIQIPTVRDTLFSRGLELTARCKVI